MNRLNPLLALSIAVVLSCVAIRASAAAVDPGDTACATQVVPTMPRSAVQQGNHDTVQVRALVRDGTVQEVELLRGPRSYANAIKVAMQQYRCRLQAGEFWVRQEFSFDAAKD